MQVCPPGVINCPEVIKQVESVSADKSDQSDDFVFSLMWSESSETTQQAVDFYCCLTLPGQRSDNKKLTGEL